MTDKNKQRNRILQRKALRKERKDLHTLPVYKAAYDTYKECRFRFRTVSKDAKTTAHEVLSYLLDIMVDIELVYWQIQDKEILGDTYRKVLKVIIIIRAMHDIGELSTQHYSIISRYSAVLSKNMGNWNNYYNSHIKEETDAEDRQNTADS